MVSNALQSPGSYFSLAYLLSALGALTFLVHFPIYKNFSVDNANSNINFITVVVFKSVNHYCKQMLYQSKSSEFFQCYKCALIFLVHTLDVRYP